MTLSRKETIGWLLLPVLLFSVIIFSLCSGSFWINPIELFTQNDIGASLINLRFIRCATAFIIGGGLAVSGTAYQAVLKNPLAEPYILGISGGASMGVAIAILLGLASISSFAIPLFAFIFALLALIVVLSISRGSFGGAYSENILLSGIIIGSICSSCLMFIISNLGSSDLNSITWWMLGYLQAADMNLLATTWVVTIGGTILLIAYGRHANVIALGEEMAYNMGISPLKTALILLGTASLITATAVSLAGIIGFVGLIVPHIMRQIFGADHRKLFALNLLYGGIFLVFCDTISRSILLVQEIPVGVITAFIGGPFFIWLLNKRSRVNG
jgi:cobalamin transport system permease protein